MFKFRTQSSKKQAALYAIVFGNVYVKFGVGVLLAFMLLQPVANVYAADEEAATAPATEAAVAEPEPEPEPEPGVIEEVEEVVEEPEPEPEPEVVEEKQTEVEEITDGTESEEVEAVAEEETVTSEETSESATAIEETVGSTESTDEQSEESVATETIATTSVAEQTETEEQDQTSTSSEVMAEEVSENTGTSGGGGGTDAVNGSESSDELSTTTSTSSEVVIDEGTLASTTLANTASSTNENADSHSEPVVESETEVVETEATTEEETETTTPVKTLADLSIGLASTSATSTASTTVPEPQFYEFGTDSDPLHFTDTECVSMGDGAFHCSKETGDQSITEEVVYSELDSEGDEEIYFKDGRNIIQISNNSQTDSSPNYDPQSHSIVWNRLQNGNNHIIHYDIDSGVETQITSGPSNNMEPAHENEYITWQRWLDNNWEIMLFDGNDEIRLTTSQAHDIAPDIQGGYVIWHTNDMQGERAVAVYEIETGLTSLISDSDGGKVENPRFVLVYDTKFDNGDVVTKGFDPETGEVVPLSAQPADAPLDLPEPEPTGETTALIQSKPPNVKEDGVDEVTGASTSTQNLIPDSTATSSVETENVSSSTPTDVVVGETVTEAEEVLPLNEYDLIVEPYSALDTVTGSTQVGDSVSSTDNVE